jgi:hypothetical protein
MCFDARQQLIHTAGTLGPQAQIAAHHQSHTGDDHHATAMGSDTPDTSFRKARSFLYSADPAANRGCICIISGIAERVR